MVDDSTEHIARISYGKDSLKMLDVIKSRGLIRSFYGIAELEGAV